MTGRARLPTTGSLGLSTIAVYLPPNGRRQSFETAKTTDWNWAQRSTVRRLLALPQEILVHFVTLSAKSSIFWNPGSPGIPLAVSSATV